MNENDTAIASVIDEQIKCGFYDQFDDSKILGIARLAMDRGFSTLSVAQQRVIEQHLTQICAGSTDPGGYHNGCTTELIAGELADAYGNDYEGNGPQCESCREEDSFYEHQWSRIEAE